MYSLCVRDHFMIAHSLTGDVFGPAQNVHGATYIVDFELHRSALDKNGIVVDIGLANQLLGSVLSGLNYRNLDEESSLKDTNTTTEVLARIVADRIAERIYAGELGDAGNQLASIRITLRESHVAWASYEKDLDHQN